MVDTVITEDALLGGRVRVFQPEKGFRAGTDSVLLGASLAEHGAKGNQFSEFGCGVGGALFPAMVHLPQGRFTAVERDEAMVRLAWRGAQANQMTERLSMFSQSVEAFAKTRENTYDLVFSNPPYYETGKIAAPGIGKAGAYVESLGLEDWLKAMLFVAKPRGYVVIIHRAAELARILARLNRQAGDIVVLPIRPYPGAEASRVLVRARKGLRSGSMRLLDGLDLHTEKGGVLTARADGVLRGAALDWF